METILITGGSGLIGQRLSELLTNKGYSVRHLSRSEDVSAKYPTFLWNISANYIDPEALKGIDHIVHLAGESVANKRWSTEQKETILSSRVKSANLILKSLGKQKIKSYISASGISIYGAETTSNVYKENEFKTPSDFLARVTEYWEGSAFEFEKVAQKVVCIRTPIVLSSQGGALTKITKPISLGVGSALGSGEQYMPWIHIDDLCHFYIKAIEDITTKGIYNAVAASCTNSKMTHTVAKVLNKKIWAPKVPAFVLKLILGEMSEIVLNGSAVNNEKMLATGINLKYPSLEKALINCLRK